LPESKSIITRGTCKTPWQNREDARPPNAGITRDQEIGTPIHLLLLSSPAIATPPVCPDVASSGAAYPSEHENGRRECLTINQPARSLTRFPLSSPVIVRRFPGTGHPKAKTHTRDKTPLRAKMRLTGRLPRGRVIPVYTEKRSAFCPSGERILVFSVAPHSGFLP
jgi:hypothetical protein